MKPSQRGLELWGGIECTVNRVGDTFNSQMAQSGHQWRDGDLERIAQLGVHRLRYPVLWELTAPDSPHTCDWRWADRRLDKLRALGIDPIVGLLHHGSGPMYTDLLHPNFPELFARYAQAVARRFPWVQHYTPINEPLTTARFSALYGHWYPHHCCDSSFARAIVNQCRAIILAMREIRSVNSAAQLIQTEDLGRVSSTARLAYQAEYENERRFLTWDLLCGRVSAKHPLYAYLRRHGIDDAEIAWFEENPCPPDVIGVNHYLTSDRYLDHDPPPYPLAAWGGNGRHRYVDVEAVRVHAAETHGVAGALRDAWHRYSLPLAITEAHLGCTREEQLRWLHELWCCAQRLHAAGTDVRAVTVWSLFGSFDWDSLLTRFSNHYEPGAFDVRAPEPRPTALAGLITELARGEPYRKNGDVLASPGWWHRPARYLAAPAEPTTCTQKATAVQCRPLLIAGAAGTLGHAFVRVCDLRGLSVQVFTRAQLDICDTACLERVLNELQPWAVINAAGYVRVDDAEQHIDRCFRENVQGPVRLAAACAARALPLVTFSSDLVFDGRRRMPYVETHPVAPLNVYGLSKARAEREVLTAHPHALIVRTSAFFGPWDNHNFLTLALHALTAGQEFAASEDVVSPTYVPDLVNATLDLLIDGEHGLWHLANEGSVSWLEFARRAAGMASVDSARLVCRRTQLGAARPAFSALASERGVIMPTLEDALARYVAAR